MFESNVQGIPCQDQITRSIVERQFGLFPGYCDFEYEIYDRKGYRAKWLEAKITNNEHERIVTECYDQYMNH